MGKGAAGSLVLIIVCTLLFAGCVSPAEEKSSPGSAANYNGPGSFYATSVAPTRIVNESSDDWARVYANNLTSAKKKIPMDLLQIIDPNYPEEHRHFTKNDLQIRYEFIPANEASEKFNISEKTALSDGGEISLQIDLQPSATLDSIDAYVTKVDLRDERHHFVDAWVGLNTMEKIAMLPDVIELHPNSPATTF